MNLILKLNAFLRLSTSFPFPSPLFPSCPSFPLALLLLHVAPLTSPCRPSYFSMRPSYSPLLLLHVAPLTRPSYFSISPLLLAPLTSPSRPLVHSFLIFSPLSLPFLFPPSFSCVTRFLPSPCFPSSSPSPAHPFSLLPLFPLLPIHLPSKTISYP